MNNTLPTVYQNFIYKSRYSRWIESENRRENFDESVDRLLDYYQEHLEENHDYKFEEHDRTELREAILNLSVMPSMRSLMTAGPALKRDNVAGYNCAFIAIDSPRAFDEMLSVLLCGTGVGYSVEQKYISQLPTIADDFHDTGTIIVVDDSKLGWTKSLKELISLLYIGQVPKWDVSKVRPAGSRLKVFGGRASGPAPLVDLFKFTIATFKKAAGRKLTSLEAHDICCKIADIVVVGGVRRAALISLSDLSDDRMRTAKSGEWWNDYGHRRLANNSASYYEKPEVGMFMKEWLALYESKSGERGIFSQYSAKKVIENANSFREKYFKEARLRDAEPVVGCNPCSEILLRPDEFCNLTEAVVRPTDTLNSLKEKIRLATILGTIQSTLTNFKYLSKKWKKNCEDERLLGVSLTGVFDHPVLNGREGQAKLIEWLEELKKVAIQTNMEYADKIGINQSVAITCLKPSGTVSALVDSASGIHARHAPHYIRYVRNDVKDPLTNFMMAQGVQWEKDAYDPNNMVAFKFPMKAPENAIFRQDLSALEHLELWKTYQIHWCEHKPSITVSVKESEWIEVASWVYNNFDWVSGISFLPQSEHVYTQAPFTDCDEEEYKELLAITPTSIDWEKLSEFEKEDSTTGTQEYSCQAGGCEF
jgi:ribonucleoside-diphosphate reductase alpha chain